MLSLTAVAAVAATFLVWRWFFSSSARRVPKALKELPGPKGYPFFGVLFDFPKHYSYCKMKDWADEYGPIYKFEILGMTHVVLCTQDIANDLLALNGAIYSDRPYMTMAYELVSRTGNLATAPNGKYWRNARKFAHTHLSSAAAANTWMPVQAAEAPRLVCDLVKDPENYAYFFERFSTLVSLRMGFGKKVPPGPEEAQHVNTIMTITHTIERTVAPGAYLVDFVPALKYLPEFLARFKAEARDLFDYEWSYFTGLMSDAHKSMIVGEVQSPPCFAHSYFAKKDAYDLSEFEATYTLGTLFEGGSGTTSAAMQSFCLAMGHYPEWQAKTQKEIDDVVGSHRLPSFDDMPNLPIVRAVIKETLRWRPVVPGGIPHRLTEDDNYNGYFIPKGAIVHANQFAMVRQESEYPDPETFRPDRWLDPKFPTYQEPLTQYPNLKRYSAFGFGRRICPGLESAERSLFIEVASMMWVCSIRKKKDQNGLEIPIPWYDYTTGNNTAPKKFQFDIEPRDQERLRMMTKIAEATV